MRAYFRNTGLFLHAFSQVDQLTLSACNTALGSKEWGGREVEGLGVLAQKRGTKSVMATLWNVADSSTGIFMPRFYTLLREGCTKAEALRGAQVYFIEGKAAPEDGNDNRGRAVVLTDESEETPPTLEGYRHPYFWASFILMGNWL